MTGPWVGIDPGGSFTGVVVRHGDRLLHHELVVRTEDEDVVRGVGVGPKYLAAVLQAVISAKSAVEDIDLYQRTRVAVEGVVPPSPHIKLANGAQRKTNPGPIIGTGMVIGAILGVWSDAVIVPPDHNGAGMLGSYPHALITPGEMRLGLRRKAGDDAIIHHCRSAWDVSLKGPEHAAIRSARRGATA